MTVQEALDMALSFNAVTAEQDDSLVDHAVNITNAFLAECLVNENAIRESEGMSQRSSAPRLKELTDTVPYSDKLVSGLPFFLASFYGKNDADNVWANRYYEMYVHVVTDATPINAGVCNDFWGVAYE